MEPNSRCRSNGDSDLFQSHLLPGVKLRHIQNFSGLSSLLSPTNFECLRCLSGVHSVNSICATSPGLSHTQFFISSLVKAHSVRFFSGRLANGQELTPAFRLAFRTRLRVLLHLPIAISLIRGKDCYGPRNLSPCHFLAASQSFKTNRER